MAPQAKRQTALEKETSQEVHAIPKVQVLKVQPAPTGAGADLQIPGTTLAYEEAAIYARASGYLSRRLVDIGDRVQEGQLLAAIDAPDLDKQMAQAVSTLRQSQSSLAQMEAQVHLQSLNYDRYKVLVAKGVFSRQQEGYLAQARSTEVAARSVWIKARVALDRSVGNLLEKNGITYSDSVAGQLPASRQIQP